MCATDFSNFVDCIWKDDGGLSELLEDEFRADLISEIRTCYSPNMTLARKQRLCLFRPNGFEYDFFNERDTICPQCRTMSRFMRDELLLGDDATHTCMSKAFNDAIAVDMQPCHRRSLGQHFQLNLLPGVHSPLRTYQSKLLDSASVFMSANSRQDACRRRDAGRWESTKTCTEYRSAIDGRSARPLHAVTVNKCFVDTTATCPVVTLAALFRTTCSCLYRRRVETSERLKSVQMAITRMRAGKNHQLCVDVVKSLFLSKTTSCDWYSTMDKILTECPGVAAPITHRQLIDDGCRILQEKGRIGPLIRGVNLIANFIDFNIDRMTRFCSFH